MREMGGGLIRGDVLVVVNLVVECVLSCITVSILIQT